MAAVVPPSPLRVAVLTSRRAPGLDVLLERAGRNGCPYRVVGVVASEPGARGIALAEARGIPGRVHSIEAFTRRRGGEPGDRELRPAYDRLTLSLLEPLGPDALVTCGYLLLVDRPILSAFPGRILNVHDADLRLRDPEGGPRYPGLHATLDALAAGEPETRSTVHLVDETVDGGPPVAVSGAYPVSTMVERALAWGNERLLRAYAFAHREWMMEDCWGQLLDRGLRALGAARRTTPASEVEAPLPPGPAPAAARRRAGAAGR